MGLRVLGEQTKEPLSQVITNDLVSVAQYAKRHNLLDTPGWRRLKRLARQDSKPSQAQIIAISS